MVQQFFDQKTETGTSATEELAQELHKPVTKNSENKKKYARFKDNIWAADLAEMRSLSYFNCGVKYLVYVIDIFTKYTWVKHFKDKKSLKIFFMVLLKY